MSVWTGWTALLFVSCTFLPFALIAAYLVLIVLTPTTLARSPAETFYLSAEDPAEPRPLTPLSDDPELSLSIVVPAYNESDRLGSMVDEAMVYLCEAIYGSDTSVDAPLTTLRSKAKINPEWFNRGVELIIVDDGSKDNTADIALSLASKWQREFQAQRNRETLRLGSSSEIRSIPKTSSGGDQKNRPIIELRVVRLSPNRGKGGAVRHGVLFARGERILFADADGASRFSDLTSLQIAMDALVKPSNESIPSSSPCQTDIAANQSGHARRRSMDSMFGRRASHVALVGHGLVAGSRAHLEKSQAVVQRSFVRNLLMHGFHIFVRTLGVSGIRDTQCGFKLFTRETARVLFPEMHLHRWSFDVELLLLASIVGVPVAEVPIDWHEVAGSKISVGWDGIGMARDLLVLRGNLLTGRWRVPQIVVEPCEPDKETG